MEATIPLQDEVAIITGGAGGIGRAIALRLASAGARIAIFDVDQPGMVAIEKTLMDGGTDVLSLSVDVTCWDEVRRAVNRVLNQWSKIDILVNDAGIQGPIGPLGGNDVEAWHKTVAVNLFGPFHCMRAVLPHMIGRKKGKIVNLSGGGASGPRPNFSAYSASKTAIVRLTETVAEEVRPFNIQINAIAPGAVNTSMLQELLAAGELAGQELQEAHKRQAEGGTDPALAAELALFLCSPASDEVTGKLISAVWDDWRSFPDQKERLRSNDLYTLRRVTEKRE